MNTSRLVSVLLVLVAVVVLVVALVFFFEKKNKEGKEEESTETTSKAGTPVSVVTLNVVTYLKDSKVKELQANPDLFLLDARAKDNYQSNNVPVTVVSEELNYLPGYKKYTHTLPKPFQADGLVFDGLHNFRFFPQPLVNLTAYLWNSTVLFLTFHTSGTDGVSHYYHFTANPTEDGLSWTNFEYDTTVVLDPTVLSPKLEELNTTLGNVVALNLDEFVDANTGTYTTEVGGVRTTFNLLKRPFTQTDFVKLTHKLLYRNTNTTKPFQLKKVLVSGSELNDLDLPNKPVASVSVFWWYNVPLLAELEFVAGNKEYFVFNPKTNAWANQFVDKVRTKLTVLKNKLGVPLTVDLGKTPAKGEDTYTSNEVLVRVSANSLTNNAFPSYTHRFSTGQPHFVGSFVNAGTPQSGLPSLRVDQLTVYFSNDVPLVLKLDLAGSGDMRTKTLFYYNNGFGFWDKFPLTPELSTPEAVLGKLDAENKKLVATNDKYAVDVFSKSDYLTHGKPLKVSLLTQALNEYTVYTHKAKGDLPFKFEKLVHGGKDVKTAGLEPLTNVTSATVYWFLNNPLYVKLEGSTQLAAPLPQSPLQQPQLPGGAQAPGPTAPPRLPGDLGSQGGVGGSGVPGGAGVTPVNTRPGVPPVLPSQQATNFSRSFSYNAETKVWGSVSASNDEQLKLVLNASRATFGTATVNVGHGVGTYETGPVTVTVSVLRPYEKESLASLDVMVHDFSFPFLLGKMKHFDFDMKLRHTVTKTVQQPTAPLSTPPERGGPAGPAAPQEQRTVTETVPYPLDGVVVKKVEVYVYRYVPLLFKLFLQNDTNVMFANTFTQSTWDKFQETSDVNLPAKLKLLKQQLTNASSLDVCKELKEQESATYQLPSTFGERTVNVTLAKMETSQPGLKAFTHTLGSNDVKLTSLTCGDRVMTGLDMDQVGKVSVYMKGGSVSLVKTNSDPKFFTNNGTGTLSHHALPQGTNDLNATQLGELLTEVSKTLGPVLRLNLEAKETYTTSGNSMLVDHEELQGEWNLYVHHLPPRPESSEEPTQAPTPGPATPAPQGAPTPPPADQGSVPDTPTGAQPQQQTPGTPAPTAPAKPKAPLAPPHFTVSKFLQGEVDAVGLPLDKSFTDVYVVLKGNVPHVLGLKTLGFGDYEWFVFNKYRWLLSFTTKDLLDREDLLTFAKEVQPGLDNEFDLELSPELQNEEFFLEHQELTPADDLEGFTLQTYTPLDNKYPVLLNSLSFNGNLLSVPFLQSHHLNGFSSYMFHGEPVLLHAYTFDNKPLFFENGFEGEWKVSKVGEFTQENVEAKLRELKALAVKFVTLNLNQRNLYRSFGGKVNVDTVKEGDANPWAPFKSFTHTLPVELPTAGATATETVFKVAKVVYNGVDLKLPLPKGTVTSAVVFANNDQVPLALYLRLTGPAKKPETPTQGNSAQQPSPAQGAQPNQAQPGNAGAQGTEASVPANPPPAQPPTQNPPAQQQPTLVVTHNYFFNNAGNWEKLAENNAELPAEALKKKLTDAQNSLGFYVEVDLAQKLPYVYTKTVEGNAAPKVVDFFVQYNPKDAFNYSTYTHVPQLRAATQGAVKTTDFSPLVTYFTLEGQRLRGFDVNKLVKLTVYWNDDKYPLMVYVNTPVQHKFFRNMGDNNWALLKTQLEQPTNQDLFKVLALAKQSFTYETHVELGVTNFAGYWHKYTNGGVSLKVTKLANLEEFKVFSHTSVSPGFPTFFVNEFKLWDRPVYGGLSFKYVHEVKVFTDSNNLPLLVEVTSSKFNALKSPLKFTYLTFDQNAYSGWFLRLNKQVTVKLNNEEVLKLLKEVKVPLEDTVFLNLDAKADYNSRDGAAVSVGNEEVVRNEQAVDTKFKSVLHTFTEGVLLVLSQNGKRVGFDNRPSKFNAANVYWLGGAPVYAKFRHFNGGGWSHYFHWPNGTWANTLPFEFNFTNAQLNAVLTQVLKLHDDYYTLDLGTKTVTSAFGDTYELGLVEYRHANVELPEEVVGYSLLPPSHKDFRLAALKVYGLDFKDFHLTLPTLRVMYAHVYSPDAFYAPLFLELVTLEPAPTLYEVEPKLSYHYYHATHNGKWTFLNTEGLRLDPAHMGYKLATFANPVPVMVDFGKREGTYGLNELTVTKVSSNSTWPFTKYLHKTPNSEPFLVSKWVYNGLLLRNLPVLKATAVSLYFYEDVVPLLVEVNSLGLVKFFSPDLNGNFTPDLVSRTSVFSYLNYLAHELTQSAKALDEWVPQLNLKLLREFELVPEEPVKVPVPAEKTTKAPAAPAPAEGSAGQEAVTPKQEPAKPAEGSATPPTQPETPKGADQQAGATPQTPTSPVVQGPRDQSTLTTAALSPNQVTTVAPATAVEGNRLVSPVTTGQSSVATRVQQTGPLAAREANAALTQPLPARAPTGDNTNVTPKPQGEQQQAPGATETTDTPPAAEPKTPEERLAAALKVPTADQVPTVTPVQRAEVVSGAKAGVVPLAPPVTKVLKPKRKFRLVPLDYDKLFNGYLSLGKFVNVTRFEDVPFGYRFARHSFVNQEAKHLANKFFVGDKLYSLPAKYLEKPANERKANSVGFYSYLHDPLLLKLGFEGKKPVFFSFNKNEDTWKEHKVVNLEEELENLNHEFNNAFVFDLGKPVRKHHPYYNDTTYYVSELESLDTNLFELKEYEAFDKVYKRPEDSHQTYTQLPFKLGKLRLNAVDLPVEGLPLGKVFYTLRAHFSKLLKKPLVLVLYPDQDEGDRKRFERDNPGKYLGYHFHFNVNDTWTFFVPEGQNSLLNKLKELESLFKEPPALDLAKVTGVNKLLNYWTDNDEFVVEKLFFAPPPTPEARPEEPTQAPTPPAPTPGSATPAPQGAPTPPPADQGGVPDTPTGAQPPTQNPPAPPGPAAPPKPKAPEVNKVDPLLGLPEKTGALQTDVMYTEVPLVPYAPVTRPDSATGFEWFYHHTPYFVQTVPVTPQDANQPSQQSTNSLQGTPTPSEQTPAGDASGSGQQPAPAPEGEKVSGDAAKPPATPAAPKTKKVVKVKRFQLGKVLNLGFPLHFELPFERLATGWAGFTVLYEKNWNTPFLFALFNPKENSPDLASSFYDLWVFRDMKWVKTNELEEFYQLFRAFELRHDLEEFNDLLPKFYQKLNQLSNLAKVPQTHLFSVDLGQADSVTHGDVVVNKDAFVLDGVDLVKSTFTPKLTAPTTSWVDFTLEKVTLFEHKYFGLDLPLTGVFEVNAYFRNKVDRFAKFVTVLEFVQKLLKDGKPVFRYWYYLYEDGNRWKLHSVTFNKLADHEVFDLVNSKLFEYFRVSLLNENSLLLDLDTRFSHMSLGRFVDAVDFFHDPSPNAPYSPVPPGFVLYRHSMVTENTTFLLKFMKLNGVVTETNFLWPFVQYFVYYKVGEVVPFVVVLAQGSDVAVQPTHHWYYVDGNRLVKFVLDATRDVDPDAQAVKELVANKFAQLLKTPPTPLAEEDPLTKQPPQGTVMPVFPNTPKEVLSNSVNKVLLTQEDVQEEERRKLAYRDRRFKPGTDEYKDFLAKAKRNLAA